MKNLNLKTMLYSIGFMLVTLLSVGLFTDAFNQFSHACMEISVIDTLKSFVAPASGAIMAAMPLVKIKKEDGTEFEFSEKSAEELDKLDSTELGAYYANKAQAEKVLLEKSFNEKIEALKKENSEDSEKISKQIEDLTNQHKEAIKEIEKFAVKMKAISETSKTETYKCLTETLKEAFESNEEFKSIISGGKQKEPIFLTTKDPVTIGLDTTVEAVGSDSQVSVTRNTGIVSTIRKRVLKYLSAGVSIGSLVGDNKAMWIEELDEQGDPIFIGEGDDKTELSVRYEERDKKARKIGVYGKVTTELMRNLPSLINYIQNNLMRRVDIKTEDQLFDGDDTGDNLAGIIDYATAFTGGGLVTTDPSYADVFRAVALQVEKAFGTASAVFVKPQILAEMDVEKDDDGHYLMPPFRNAEGNMVSGIRLISSNALNSLDEDFVGGDLSVVNVMFSDNMSVQIGMDGNDFTKNKKTILVEQELVQFVSANDTQVLVKGDMATAITAITAT